MAIVSGRELLQRPQEVRGGGGGVLLVIIALTLGFAVVAGVAGEAAIENASVDLPLNFRKSLFD